MSDSVLLKAMEFVGHHGLSDEERAEAQVIEVDIEYELDLRPAGTSDDIADTVSYVDVFEICRNQVEEHSYHLLESLGQSIADEVLGIDRRVERVVVIVRKPGVPIDGVLDHAGVRLERSRA